MYRACSKCGKVHSTKFKCTHNKPKFDADKYGTSEERKLRSTTAWGKKSQQVREDAQQLCEVCRVQNIYNFNNLEVHHITKLREDKTGLLDDSNLVCLCSRHHKQADAGQISKEYLKELAIKRINKIEIDTH